MFKKISLLLMIGVMVLVLAGCPSDDSGAWYVINTDGHLKIAFDEFEHTITRTVSLTAGTFVDFDIRATGGTIIVSLADDTGRTVFRIETGRDIFRIETGPRHTLAGVMVDIDSDFVLRIEGQDFSGMMEILW